MSTNANIDGTWHTYIYCFTMEILYIILFANFFHKSYIKGGGKKFISEKEVNKRK